ncbi:MAG: 1-acyl-sn-glycerol-3-phosphate acyltransferase [Salinivirgaceae bacterium]|jgi:putative hemolysin|nr:1-acyl-sn-glycerol-3-phosphate acyltransferase [Salinivirgaceae bacterium]
MDKKNTEQGNISLIDIDRIIKDKSPRLYKSLPGFIINWLKRTIHQDTLNDIISANYNGTPLSFSKNSLLYFGLKLIVKGTENLPKDNKRMVFVANHPLGGLDGMAFIQAVSEIYDDVKFPVNDLLLNVPALNKGFIPINKHGKQSREAIKAIDDAFLSELPVLYFPAGLCSRKVRGEIVDLGWKKAFLSQAIKHKRDVVPVYINGKNSKFFYNLSNFRKYIGLKANIEMLYLADEMVKQNNKEIVITYGKPIPYQTFDKSKTIWEWVEYVRQKTYALK